MFKRSFPYVVSFLQCESFCLWSKPVRLKSSETYRGLAGSMWNMSAYCFNFFIPEVLTSLLGCRSPHIFVLFGTGTFDKWSPSQIISLDRDASCHHGSGPGCTELLRFHTNLGPTANLLEHTPSTQTLLAHFSALQVKRQKPSRRTSWPRRAVRAWSVTRRIGG